MKKNTILIFNLIIGAFIICSCGQSTGGNISAGNTEKDSLSIEKMALAPKYITIGSWNTKNFGLAKLHDTAKMRIIVNVIHKFDIIALEEIKDVSNKFSDELMQKINTSGYSYKYIISKRLGPTNPEQYLILYNCTLKALTNTSGYGYEPNNEFKREPFYQEFKAGNFDFYLMVIHTDPDEVKKEIPALKNAYLKLQENTTKENDIILVGDFNGKAPGVSYGSYITMDALAEIPNLTFTIKGETNTEGGKTYDNIVFQTNYTTEYTNQAGVLHIWEDYAMTRQQAFEISDHCPVWAKFSISGKDDD